VRIIIDVEGLTERQEATVGDDNSFQGFITIVGLGFSDRLDNIHAFKNL